MFDNSERQIGRVPESSIYLSNLDDPRIKKIRNTIAEQKNKLLQNVTNKEIVAYLEENHIPYIANKKENKSKIQKLVDNFRSRFFS